MAVQLDRRSGNDRREYALYYRYGVERREYSEARRTDEAAGRTSATYWASSLGYWGSSEDPATTE